jgi:hypothetical protein
MQPMDTFPKKLEQMLNLNADAPRVEVLNRGVNGSSTENEVELVKQALKEGPDLLILEITLNDAEPQILTDQERKELFEAPWLRWRIFSTWKSLGLVAQRIHNSQTVRRYIDYHSKFFKDPATRAKFSQSIQRIANQARTARVPLMAVIFPLFDFPINRRYPFAEVHTIVEETLRSHGVRAVDLQTAYRGIPPERLQVIPGKDNHPNEIAHRIAAEQLLAVLAQDAVIPDATIPRRVFGDRQGLKTRSRDPLKTLRKAAQKVAPPTTTEDEKKPQAPTIVQ